MKVTEHIKKANGKTLFSFELLPPNKGETIESIYNAIDPLMEFNPPFIEVTYHREDYTYVERPDGLLEKKVTRKRPGTLGISAAIQHKYGVDAIPHGISTEVPAKYVYDAMFTAQNLGQGFAASTMMLLTVVIVVIPWAILEFGGTKKSV